MINQSVITTLLNKSDKETVYIAKGDYDITSPINLIGKGSLHVIAHPEAKFIANKSFPANGAKLFNFNSTNKNNVKFIWEGGQFHGQNIPARTVGAPDVFAVVGDGINQVSIKNTSFYRTKKGSVGATTLFIAAASNVYIENVLIDSADDSAIYISGNQAQTHGDNLTLTGSRFNNNNVGVIGKRNYKNIKVVGNTFTNGNAGVVLGGQADYNKLSGDTGIVKNNVFTNIINPISIRYKSSFIVSNNIIQSIGSDTEDGRGISLDGSKNTIVKNNILISKYTRSGSSFFRFMDTQPSNPNSYLHSIATNNIISDNMLVGNVIELINWSTGTNIIRNNDITSN